MTTSRSFTKTLLLIGIVAGFCLLLLELGVRILMPVQPTIYKPHDLLIHALKPGKSKTFVRKRGNGGDRIPVRINSKGFRGEELLDASRRDIRVVVYGDSFIEGEYSLLENTFAEQLEKNLQGICTGRVEVVNAGVVGYGPDQVSLRMEWELNELTPDLAVVAIFADNDFGDLLRNKLYRLDDLGQLVENPYQLADQLRNNLERAASPDELSRLRSIPLLKNTLYYLWRAILRNLAGTHSDAADYKYAADSLEDCRREFEEYIIEGDNTVRLVFNDHYDTDIAVDPKSASARYKMALMDEVIGRLAEITSQHGVPLLVVIIPSPLDICSHYDYGVNREEFPAYDPARLSGTLEDILVRRDMAYLNLYPRLAAVGADPFYFRYGDDHWNDAGQAWAAAQVSGEIRARRWLASQGCFAISELQ